MDSSCDRRLKVLLSAVQAAYKKHVLGDEDIGWDQLGDQLGSALAEVMGDKEFCAWMNEVESGLKPIA